MESVESQPSNISKNSAGKSILSSPMAKTQNQNVMSSPWKSKTPDKTSHRRVQARRRVAFSVKEVRTMAKELQVSDRVDDEEKRDEEPSARKQILQSPRKSSDRKSISLPEKYEMFCKLFESMDSAIRLLRMKGSTTLFSRICPQVESLTDRRFNYEHLAQMKYILPEAFDFKKVLVKDEKTSCMKSDLHVNLDATAIVNDNKLKSSSASLQLRKVFRARLLEFVKCNPEGSEIPEETLPEPFNRTKQGLSLRNLDASMRSLPTVTPSNLPLGENPAIASHLSQAFKPRFSQAVKSRDVQKTQSEPSEESNQKTMPCPAPSPIKLPPKPAPVCTPTSVKDVISKHQPLSTPSKINRSKGQRCLASEVPDIQGTPVKDLLTPAKLQAVTSALQTPKRSHLSPQDDSCKTPNKLVRRLSRVKSLKFNTPVKDAKAEELAEETGCSSTGNDLLDVLGVNLLESIKEKERRAMEEKDPAISQAKRRRDMIAGLPKLFDMIHLFFQSNKRSVVTKQEFVHSIISVNLDMLDRGELEEQLKLLQELVPEYISENGGLSGDVLLRINKATSAELIRATLANAK